MCLFICEYFFFILKFLFLGENLHVIRVHCDAGLVTNLIFPSSFWNLLSLSMWVSDLKQFSEKFFCGTVCSSAAGRAYCGRNHSTLNTLILIKPPATWTWATCVISLLSAQTGQNYLNFTCFKLNFPSLERMLFFFCRKFSYSCETLW